MSDFTEAPVSVTFKVHAGYDSPMITFRAFAPAEFVDLVSDAQEAGLEGAVLAFQGLLTAAYGFSEPPTPAHTSSPSQPASPGSQGGRPASEKQLQFLEKLSDERGIIPDPNLTDAKGVSEEIDRLMAMSKTKAKPSAPRGGGGGYGGNRGGGGNGPSPKQRTLIQKLEAEKDTSGIDPYDVDSLTGGRDGTASKVIDALMDAPEKSDGAWG